MKDVWLSSQYRGREHARLPNINFNDFISSTVSTGPYYSYIIDFSNLSISNVSRTIADVHGFEPDKITLEDILSIVHPDDVHFVTKIEAALHDLFYKRLGREKLLTYKISYSFRAKMKDGRYELLNHQAIMLNFDERGGYGQSLNIHTQISHLSKTNSYRYSLISLTDEPSYMNLGLDENEALMVAFSKREIDIIELIAEGHNSSEIAKKLFISDLTVKQHRKNMLNKAGCKNTAQLVRFCMLQGLI